MKTIQINLYSFDELSNQAQEKAHNDFLSLDREFFWMSENIESIKKGLEFYGFELTNWTIEYWSAACSSTTIRGASENINELTGVRLWKYLQNNYSTYWSKYSKKREPTLGGNCPFTGYCADESFLDPVREFIKKPCKHTTFYQLMEQCVESVLQGIQVDYEYQCSLEFFKEECASNDYEFLEDGTKY